MTQLTAILLFPLRHGLLWALDFNILLHLRSTFSIVTIIHSIAFGSGIHLFRNVKAWINWSTSVIYGISNQTLTKKCITFWIDLMMLIFNCNLTLIFSIPLIYGILWVSNISHDHHNHSYCFRTMYSSLWHGRMNPLINTESIIIILLEPNDQLHLTSVTIFPSHRWQPDHQAAEANGRSQLSQRHQGTAASSIREIEYTKENQAVPRPSVPRARKRSR